MSATKHIFLQLRFKSPDPRFHPCILLTENGIMAANKQQNVLIITKSQLSSNYNYNLAKENTVWRGFKMCNLAALATAVAKITDELVGI